MVEMIDVDDIQRAIRETLEYRLKTLGARPDIDFKGSDIQKAKAKDIYITYVTDKTTRIASEYEQIAASFEVAYFGIDYKDLLKMRGLLVNIFKSPVETLVDGKVLSVDIDDAIDFAINKNDSFLTAVIDAKVVQKIDENILNNKYSRFGKATNENEEFIEELEARIIGGYHGGFND